MKKKIIKILLIILTIFNTTIVAKADSGFDTSYGSGGGWNGGSYSGNSHWNMSSDSSGGAGIIFLIPEPLRPYVVFFFCLIFILFFIYCMIKMFYKIIIEISKIIKETKNKKTNDNMVDGMPLPIDFDTTRITKEIKDFNEKEFLEDVYNIYVKIQEDWMNYNYNGLRENLTDELYNQYKMQLETLSEKKQKNIIKDIELLSSRIIDYKNSNGIKEIKVKMTVSLIDYIEENGELIKGSNIKHIRQQYELTLIKKDRKIETCPNCGQKLKQKSTEKCESCGSIISNINTKWVLSKKESIRLIN